MYPTLAKNFDEGHYHIETSPLIFSANQWTDFYMIWISAMKELSKFDIDTQCNTIFQIHSWITLASVGFPLMFWPVNDRVQQIFVSKDISSKGAEVLEVTSILSNNLLNNFRWMRVKYENYLFERHVVLDIQTTFR